MKDSVRRLTEAELADELRNRGFVITQRTIAEWRRNHLLPPFDVIGAGLGQGKGKERGSWSRRESVITQACWVSHLRPQYKCYEDLYLPLWMLGAPIPLEIVRDILTYPLLRETEALKAEAAALIRKFKLDPARTGVVEDLIDDAVNDVDPFTKAMREALKMPPEVIEGLLNIFLNPDCDLEDPAGVVKNGSEAVERWDTETKKLELEILQTEGVEPSDRERRDTTVADIFKHARFIHQNFSLHQLEKAATECTDDFLKRVQIDMVALCDMLLLLLNKVFLPLMKDIRAELRPEKRRVFTTLLGLGKWAIWADLSLRRNGHGQAIDVFREFVRSQIKEKVDEKVERDVAEAAPAVAEGIEKATAAIESFFTTKLGKTGVQYAP